MRYVLFQNRFLGEGNRSLFAKLSFSCHSAWNDEWEPPQKPKSLSQAGKMQHPNAQASHNLSKRIVVPKLTDRGLKSCGSYQAQNMTKFLSLCTVFPPYISDTVYRITSSISDMYQCQIPFFQFRLTISHYLHPFQTFSRTFQAMCTVLSLSI